MVYFILRMNDKIFTKLHLYETQSEKHTMDSKNLTALYMTQYLHFLKHIVKHWQVGGYRLAEVIL